MSALTIHRVNTLPGTLAPDALYFVLTNGVAETYITGSDTTGRYVGNTALIDQQIAAAGGGASALEIVADITARDALFTGSANLLALVVDASADATVDSGAAFYAYRGSDSAVYKVSEFESLDVSIDWTDISNRPTSTAAEIDTAVAAATHVNRATLDKLGEDGDGDLTYDGDGIVKLVTADW